MLPTGRRIAHSDITPELEIELALRCQAGDTRAGGVLVLANELKIRARVRRYFGNGLSEDDVMQAARMGYFKGVLRFRERQHAGVTTYALYWARKEAHDALHLGGTTIRLPRGVHDRLYRAAKAGEELSPKLARATRIRRTASLDVPVGEGGLTRGDLTASAGPTPGAAVEAADAHVRREELIARAMTRLGPRERELIERRFGEEPEALATIGASWGMSRERARQIEEDALTKMRLALRQIMAPDDAVLWGGNLPAGPMRPRRSVAAPPPAAPADDEPPPASRVMAARRRRVKGPRPAAAALPKLPANDTLLTEHAAP